MLAKTYGSTVSGVDASLITIEVNITQGKGVFMVGLPDSAIKESEHRIESAIKYLSYRMPRHKTIVNMAPADVKKEGSSFDLPIALGILQASEQVVSSHLKDYLILGELSLDGLLRPIKGALPIAIEARQQGFKGFILPKENAEEAAVVNDLDIIPVESLAQAILFCEDPTSIEPLVRDTRDLFYYNLNNYDADFSDVQGHESVKRALEVAAAGGHNIIMVGPPGSGKTMLARRLPTILPPLSLNEALETTKIYSVVGKLDKTKGLIAMRPFAAPHHTTSDVALVGGGNIPQPGQISLAHNGILFLDELPEFKRTVLEVLRQPLEERKVTISRARASVEFPANFMLVASMNPSPSGDFYRADGTHPDSLMSVQKYLSKVSGPLLDRIDIHIEVNPVSFEKITSDKKNEKSETIRTRVINARNIQEKRFKNLELSESIYSNAMMPPKVTKDICQLDQVSKTLLKTAIERLGLSSRAYDRILKVSRTIADLEGSDNIQAQHIAEAIQYRSLDREGWGSK